MSKKNLRKEREFHRQEENRRFILQAAERIFVQKGYRLATVDDIADEAQFSKATLYRYFKSKSDIFFEIIYSSFEESYNGIKKIQMKAMSAEKKIKELIGFVVSTYHKKKNLSRILFMEKAAMKKLMKSNSSSHVAHPDFHPNISPKIKFQMEKISEITCDIIKQGVETGEFRDIDIHEANVVLGSLLRGFHFRGPVQEKKYSIQETTDLLHSFFLNGIKRQKKSTKGD
ncbi:MAG: TetR/AcrR family transcriptional regulator [Candidatus Aminicenantes bacterium]|nr:MAG: TetR/AcrR family transcriptional regulator [Candidatus Aminicenantes bacterium]